MRAFHLRRWRVRRVFAPMEFPDDPELRLALFRAKQEEALNNAGDTEDLSLRASWLKIADNYLYLTQPLPGS